MGGLLFITVLLVLILTGAIVPVLIFGGWAIVVVLALVLVGAIFAKLLGLAIKPFALVGEDILDWIDGRRNRPPSPDDPDHRRAADRERGSLFGGSICFHFG